MREHNTAVNLTRITLRVLHVDGAEKRDMADEHRRIFGKFTVQLIIINVADVGYWVTLNPSAEITG